MSTTEARIGQIVVPVSARAIEGLDAQAIADEVAPYIIAAARKAGGVPIGAPELLKADELLARTEDDTFRDLVEETSPGSLYIVSEMIPQAQADEIAAKRARDRQPAREIIVPPVLPGGRRRRR